MTCSSRPSTREKSEGNIKHPVITGIRREEVSLGVPVLFRQELKKGEIAVIIRRYQAKDNPEVKKLHNDGLKQFGAEFDPYYDSDLDDIEGTYINNQGDFLVGTEDGEIVVMSAIRKYSETCGLIKRIRVRRDYQGQGYGQKILDALIERASELGYTELYLDTMANNLPAQSLFEKAGFTKTHRGKVGVYDLIFYRKKLNEGGK